MPNGDAPSRVAIANERLAMTTTTTPPVPLPVGALADDVWQEDDRPRRIIHSENRGVEGQDLVVWWDATQFADGTLDIEGNPPTVRIADLIWEPDLAVLRRASWPRCRSRAPTLSTGGRLGTATSGRSNRRYQPRLSNFYWWCHLVASAG
jgi:hypothetical protein